MGFETKMKDHDSCSMANAIHSLLSKPSDTIPLLQESLIETKKHKESEEALEIQAKKLLLKDRKIKLDSNRHTHLSSISSDSLELEKTLLKAATRSVVQFLNAINTHKKTSTSLEKKQRYFTKKAKEQSVVDNSTSKLNFLEMLRSNAQSK